MRYIGYSWWISFPWLRLTTIQSIFHHRLADHAGLQSGLRKLANTAGKCAGFDVVLTTFDSIRNKEATIPVESTGRAILGGSVPSNDDDGWFTSRGVGTQSGPSAPQKCLQLSVLHRLSWFRVIFIDILGQKGQCNQLHLYPCLIILRFQSFNVRWS
jgi:hypothetical protein